MPLPKVNTPTYELVLPSSGRKIRYRPFLVREEKILIMALESEDVKQITNAVIEILNNCVLTKGTKIEKMSTCLLYTSPSPRDGRISRMPSSA